jgi:transcriptional regulator with XRE-family HTH domain
MKGKELKAWRIRSKMTQQALADALGVHRVTVAKWEAGMNEIPHYLHLALKGLEKKKKK